MRELSRALKSDAVLTTKLKEEKLTIPDLVEHWKLAMYQIKEIKSNVAEKLRKSLEEREPSVFDNRIIDT